MRLSLPRGRALAAALAFGTVNFGVSYALTYWALQTAPAALAATFVALAPLLTFLGAVALGDMTPVMTPAAGASSSAPR